MMVNMVVPVLGSLVLTAPGKNIVVMMVFRQNYENTRPHRAGRMGVMKQKVGE